MESRYITSAMKPEQLPDYELPEIALIGRSNSGKSTLLNHILGRRKLARHGRTPGQTQMINFFGIGEQLIFADLPGYGFTKIKRDLHDNWVPLIEGYMRRPNICEFLFLIDGRRELNDQDWELIFRLGRNLPVYVLLTKADKMNRQEQQQKVRELAKEMAEKGIEVKKILPISSLKQQGIQELREDLFAHAESLDAAKLD